MFYVTGISDNITQWLQPSLKADEASKVFRAVLNARNVSVSNQAMNWLLVIRSHVLSIDCSDGDLVDNERIEIRHQYEADVSVNPILTIVMDAKRGNCPDCNKPYSERVSSVLVTTFDNTLKVVCSDCYNSIESEY